MFSLRNSRWFILIMMIACAAILLPSFALAQEQLFVSALTEGTTFVATSTGTYRFTIAGGAAEVCPPEAQPNHPEWWGWNTWVLIYKNRPIEWEGGPLAPQHISPTNWDFSVGHHVFQPTYQEAEQIGIGMFVDIPLQENDYVILVVNDSKDDFSDNSGGIHLSIEKLSKIIVDVDIKPETLNLTSDGVLTAFIKLPKQYSISNVDLNTITCEGANATKAILDGDKLIAKFRRQDLKDIGPGKEVEFTVRGELKDGSVFDGTDTVRVINGK